jgi:predicted TIM-barrel fold metal-dependent hydrolase
MDERVDEIIKGAYDCHIHGGPDVIPRKLDVVEVAREAKEAGMAGVLLVSHVTNTADEAAIVSKVVPGIEVLGIQVLNYYTGGLNPEAVTTALKLGARRIAMPSISAANHFEHEGKNPEDGISVLDGKGELKEVVLEIINIVADWEGPVALTTGHLYPHESEIFVSEAIKAGVKNVVVTHPEWNLVNMSVELQKELAKKGAYFERCLYATTEMGGNLDPQVVIDQIREVGLESTIFSTDFGQVPNPKPVDGMKSFIDLMLKSGFSEKDIDVVIKENPKKVFGFGQDNE